MSKGRAGFGAHLATVLFFVGLFVFLIIFILQQAGTLPTFGSKYRVSAEVPSANFLAPGARVTVAGAEVGQVAGVDRAGGLSPNSKIEMELTDDRVYPLPADSRIEIRTRSQVGENYVSIIVGDAKTTIPEDGTLPLANADEVVSVDQILSTLRGKTRARTRTLFKEFGAALTGRGQDLNKTLRYGSEFADYGTETVTTVAEDREQLGLLVDQLGRVTAALGDRQAAIETIARQGTVSLEAIGQRDERVAEMLRELPSTLDQVRKTSLVVGDVGDRATPVVSNLATAVREVRPAIDALAPTADDARQIVERVGAITPELVYFLNAFPGLTGHEPAGKAPNGLAVRATIPRLRDMFCELNPALRYIKPRTADLFQVIKHLGSGANAYDATGHMVRLTPILNENSLSGAPQPVLQAAQTLLSSGAFIPQKKITYDPYMEPGVIGTTTASSSGAANPQAYGKQFKYPRVRAQC
jgi:ABC-type transporter Mla subunit MlaD